MKVLQKTLLASVAGGEADEVVFAYSGGDTGTWDGSWGGGGDYGWDSASDYAWDGAGGGDYGGGASHIAAPSFDSNGVGLTSCVAMPPPPPPLATGLFGYSLTETITAGTAAGGLAYGIGQGVGASLAIEAAGGLGGIGAMGAAATGVGSAVVVGLTASFATGYIGGTLLYHNSETVQNLSQAAVGGVVDAIDRVKHIGSHLFGRDADTEPVERH